MKTHSVNLWLLSFCADFNACGSLELLSYGISSELASFMMCLGTLDQFAQ